MYRLHPLWARGSLKCGSPEKMMRLDKFICKSTRFTRSEAIELINEERVSVNGEIIKNEGTQVHENNRITLDGQELIARASRYIMIHKPPKTICSNIDEVYPSVLNCLEDYHSLNLHVAGRLDADTTGLVLATDDGRWSYNIIVPARVCEKVYRVGLRDPISSDVAVIFENGIQLQGEKSLTLPARIEVVNPREVYLTITEGRFHQVKRMFAAVGNRVVTLHRQKIGKINLDVELGQWRNLNVDEIKAFM